MFTTNQCRDLKIKLLNLNYDLKLNLINQSIFDSLPVSELKNITLEELKNMINSNLYRIDTYKVILIPNDISVKLTTDVLSYLISLGFTIIIEDFEINTDINLSEKLKYNDLIDIHEMNTNLKSFQNFKYYIIQNSGDINIFIGLLENLKYHDYFQMDIESIIKSFQLININLTHENFDISINGYLMIVKAPFGDLRNITMNELKNTTLKDLYYTEI